MNINRSIYKRVVSSDSQSFGWGLFFKGIAYEFYTVNLQSILRSIESTKCEFIYELL